MEKYRVLSQRGESVFTVSSLLLAFPFKEASAETAAVGRALPLLPLPGKAFVIACGLV